MKRPLLLLLIFSLFLSASVNTQGRGNCFTHDLKLDFSADHYIYSAPNGSVFETVAIKAGTECYFEPVPGCYEIEGIGTNTIDIERVGDGQDCKEISHVEFGFTDEKETPTPTPTPRTQTPTATQTPINPSETPTPTSTPTHTNTSTPTVTLTPTPTGTHIVCEMPTTTVTPESSTCNQCACVVCCNNNVTQEPIVPVETIDYRPHLQVFEWISGLGLFGYFVTSYLTKRNQM